MSRIFISYKRVDKDKVFKIKDQIEAALGEKCWIDLDGIESDAVFASKIIGAINDCEIFLFMYSKAHKDITDYENDWTIRELNFAQIQKKRIVFINIDGSELSHWFLFLFGTKQQININDNNAFLRIENDLKTWLHISNVEPSPKSTQYKLSQETSKNTRLVNKAFTESNRTTIFLLGLDLVCVCCWAYFFYHRTFISIMGISSITYIINFLPILFRSITSVQLYRNEKFAYLTYILFLFTSIPLCYLYGTDSFASVLYRPFEYIYFKLAGNTYPSFIAYNELKEIASFFMCSLIYLLPLAIYTKKRSKKELQCTTTQNSIIGPLYAYLMGEPLAWYVITIILSVCWSWIMNNTFTTQKILYYIMVNILLIIVTYKVRGKKSKLIKLYALTLCICFITSISVPLFLVLSSLFSAILIVKETRRPLLSSIYFVICGYIIPVLLFNDFLFFLHIK